MIDRDQTQLILLWADKGLELSPVINLCLAWQRLEWGTPLQIYVLLLGKQGEGRELFLYLLFLIALQLLKITFMPKWHVEVTYSATHQYYFYLSPHPYSCLSLQFKQQSFTRRIIFSKSNNIFYSQGNPSLHTRQIVPSPQSLFPQDQQTDDFLKCKLSVSSPQGRPTDLRQIPESSTTGLCNSLASKLVTSPLSLTPML